MREIFIKYNPYKVTTEITIDGKPVKKNSALNVGERRLQEWVELLPNQLVDECNSKDFKIVFHGTTLDYEDLSSVAKEAENRGISIICEHIPAKEVQDKENMIADIFDELQNGPFEELRQPDLVKAFKIASSSEFPVNVIATMSAGKSTLINAFIRQKLMPSKQEACTAIITEIKDLDLNTFRATVYDAHGELAATHDELTLPIMNELNSDPAVSIIRAEGDIPFVSAEDVSLVLVDTPGPNNSRNQEHKTATYRMLSESSKTLVLYILNATQLAVNDDNDLLNHVAESMRVGGKQSKDRFIFVVNKLDDFKRGEDSVHSSIEKVRKYLEDKGIHNPNIFPASALTALEIRTTLADVDLDSIDFDEIDSEVFGVIAKIKKINSNPDLHLENYAPLTPSIQQVITDQLSEAQKQADKKQEALIHTGIVPIEAAIRMYIAKYAKTAKIKNIVDTFAKKLESAKSFENTRREIATNQNRQKEVLAQIDSIKSKLSSGDNAKRFKQKVDAINYDKEIQVIAESVIGEAQKKISNEIEKVRDSGNLTKNDAKSMCSLFVKDAENIQAEVQVKLESLISNHVEKNAQSLMDQYQQRIGELSSEITSKGVSVNPFQLIAGEISANLDPKTLINKLIHKEEVKVGEEWVTNTNKKWYKPWTWFDDDGYYRDVYEEKEYVDANELATRFFAPIQKLLYSNTNNAIDYAKEQTKEIKKSFNIKFEELDSVLNRKLKELEACATDKENIEKLIQETNERLKWLEDIQVRIQEILDI